LRFECSGIRSTFYALAGRGIRKRVLRARASDDSAPAHLSIPPRIRESIEARTRDGNRWIEKEWRLSLGGYGYPVWAVGNESANDDLSVDPERGHTIRIDRDRSDRLDSPTGDFGDDEKNKDESIRYVLNSGCVDVITVGFENITQIDDFSMRVRKVPFLIT
jgi:hypothetical protein